MTPTLLALLAALASPARDSQPKHLVDDAKHIITLLNTGHADSVQSRMTTALQSQRTPTQRDSVWHVLVQKVGEFQRFGRSRVQTGPAGERTVDMEVFFAHQPVEALVTYDADARISALAFRFDDGT